LKLRNESKLESNLRNESKLESNLIENILGLNREEIEGFGSEMKGRNECVSSYCEFEEDGKL
jgi:hypothetical protein